MRVFLTGGTGYIGSAVLDALIRSGHRVTALVRDSEKAERLEARGATPVLGDLASPARFLATAAGLDAVVHTALAERRAVRCSRKPFLDAMLPALAAGGTPRTFVYTSGVWVLGSRPTATDEAVSPDPVPHVAWRAGHEAQVLAAGGPSLRTVVIRPGIVYGSGRGIVSDMLKDALNGLVRVIGDGQNRWPCVYDRDLASSTCACCRCPAPRVSTTRPATRTSGWRRSPRRSPGTCRRWPTSGTCRWPRRAASSGHGPTRWRSIRSCAARGRGPSAGRRPCTASRAMRPAYSRSTGAARARE